MLEFLIMRWRAARLRTVGALALTTLALLVTACGGGSSNSSSAPSTTAGSSSSSHTVAVVTTAKGPAGTFLAGPSGRSLYLWKADGSGMSNCTGSCATLWPPLTTKGKPTTSHGAAAGDLGTITRPDGTTQVTYKGHPLYYYAGDTGSGQTNGQGNNGFGAKWWLVTPSGSAITTSTSSGGSSTSGGSSPGGY
jgi:predicted lipoprotein with Yx(FWY)xxD motif